MKISEILKGLAAAIEQKEHDDASMPVNTETDAPTLQDMGKFSPPLQQKHELLKKVSGVDSEFDDEDPVPTESPELVVIKKLAGILHSDDDVVG